MIKDFYITPKPKYLKISNKNGIRLSGLLTIYLNKHRIKDTALHISSRFNKHFNAFLKTLPINDSYLDDSIGDFYYFTCVTTELHYSNTLKLPLNTIIKQIIEDWESCLIKYKTEQKDKNQKIVTENLIDNEGYYLNINSEVIWLISKTETGFYNGIQTLVQIIENVTFRHIDNENFIIIPELEVLDFPNIKERILDLDIVPQKSKNIVEFVENIIPFAGKFKLNELNVILNQRLMENINVKAKPHKIEVNSKSVSSSIIKKINLDIQQSVEANYFQTFVNSEVFWNFNNMENPLDNFDWDYLSKSIVTHLFEANCEKIYFDVQKMWKITSKDDIDYIETQMRNLFGNIYENEKIVSVILKSLALKKLEF